jgi:hypothetical protein
MQFFEDGCKFAINDDGEVVFRRSDTYLGVLLGGMTLNSVLFLQACTEYNTKPSQAICVEERSKHPMDAPLERNSLDIKHLAKCKDAEKQQRNRRRSPRKKSNLKHRLFNKKHKERQLAIRKERAALVALKAGDVYDVCSTCDAKTCNYNFGSSEKDGEIICDHCENIDMEKHIAFNNSPTSDDEDDGCEEYNSENERWIDYLM